MALLKRFDHVGVTVADLDTVTSFFVGLGMEVEGRTFLEGPFLDTVAGIPDARTEVVLLRLPEGGTTVELCTFLRPALQPGSPEAMATEVGLRSMCFEVEDLRGMVAALAEDGYGLLGGIGDHEGQWLMASVRGPEGLVVSLAERTG